MSKESVILIDDMILADRGAHSEATQVDMTMMFSLAGAERTRAQWDALLKSAGFKIAETHVYTPWTGETVMKVIPEDW